MMRQNPTDAQPPLVPTIQRPGARRTPLIILTPPPARRKNKQRRRQHPARCVQIPGPGWRRHRRCCDLHQPAARQGRHLHLQQCAGLGLRVGGLCCGAEVQPRRACAAVLHRPCPFSGPEPEPRAALRCAGWGCFGSACYSQALYDAIAAVCRAGGLFVAAAGNDGADLAYNVRRLRVCVGVAASVCVAACGGVWPCVHVRPSGP